MIGERLRRLRESKKWSQRYLGELVNLSQQTIDHYEKGRAEPKTDTINLFSDIFNVTTDYLLGREPQAVADPPLEYGIKEVRFPFLERDFPNLDIEKYINNIRQAVYKAVQSGAIGQEQAESMVEEATRYLMFQIKELESKNE